MDMIRNLIIKALSAVAQSLETGNSAAIQKCIGDIKKDMQENGNDFP